MLAHKLRGSMELSERKKKILHVLVDEFIVSGLPVSSKKLHEKHLLEYSPATIRNELFSLEELGFLGHTHTSSGRFPLPKAYRTYIDKLMEKGTLKKSEIEYIESHFKHNFSQAEDIVKNAAKVLSELTNYTAIGFSVDNVDENIENIKLVKLNANNLLLVVVTKRHIIKDTVITCEYDVDDNYLSAAEKILCEVFVGKTIQEAASVDAKAVDVKVENFKHLFENILKVFKEYIADEKAKVVLEGSSNIFKYNEFSDIDKTKNFLSIIDKREQLVNILKSTGDIEISVKIGKDENEQLPEDIALVSASITVNGKTVGTSGVLGPTRMDYNRVFLVMDMIKKAIENIK